MTNFKSLRVALLLLGGTLVLDGYAQNSSTQLSFSLDECLEYAKENSITLEMARLNVDDNLWEQLSSKGAFLPTIAGSINQGVVGYPFAESTSLNSSAYTGSYGVDLSMTLYNGGSTRAQLQKSVMGEDIAQLAVDELSNSLEVAITETYIQILYAIEQVEVAEGTLSLSEQNEERGRAFMEVGSINAADFAQLQSATATSKYNVVIAKTQLSNLYVLLKQMLEISGDVTLSVKSIPLSDEVLLSQIPAVSEVYEVALDARPEIKSSQLYIESAELDHQIAKSEYLPTLNLTAGTGVSHSSASSYEFSSQLRNNFSTSAGLSLSIPIFTGYKNKSNVAIAQNSVKRATLSLAEAEKTLYQTIETLRNNAVNAQAIYSVSEYLLEASLKSMELTAEQYEQRLKNTIELLTEQDNYNQAAQDHLINKYQLILNKALLNYYKTNIIKL